MGDFFLPTKKSFSTLRVPPPIAGIQVNFCKNMDCSHFGVPASHIRQKRGPGELSADGYIIGQKKGQRVRIKCKRCNQYSTLKSNQGVFEEMVRLSAYLDLNVVVECCPDEGCCNYGVDVSEGKPFYQKFGVTDTGSRRYRCKGCSKTFSISARPTARQRVAYKNKMIMKLLMNKEPLGRICEVADVSMRTVYRKIDFIHAQCLAFIADRERKLLLGGFSIPRLYLASDQQEYIVNWTNTKDKRNVIVKAIGTADMRSGYVFGMHVNYDASLDPEFVRAAVERNGDEGLDMPFREFARIWLEVDHATAERKRPKRQEEPIPPGGLGLDIALRYQESLGRVEIEASDDPEPHIRLPHRGMQIHEDYTMYGHFFFLKKLLANAGKVRFFLDQDSGIRAACLSAFADEVVSGRCDAFYVRINKDLTIHQKQRLVAIYKRDMDEQRHKYPLLSDKSIRLLWIADEMKRLKAIGRWEDRWLQYPFPDMSEPEKAVCYLTNRNDLEEMQLANLYHMASLHAIDSYFNQIRSRLNPLDRPKKSMSNQNRIWSGYQPYDPALVQKLLDIFRVYYNFHLKSKGDKKTPAMRLGLAKGPITVDEIVNFKRDKS